MNQQKNNNKNNFKIFFIAVLLIISGLSIELFLANLAQLLQK
jgi:hypothetical protein